MLQEPLLFSGTLGDNIRYGRLDATDDEVIEAARAANAHDFIDALPHGYGTMIGERGARLSGGERQRISVARAFLKDAPILILDEPTSSIDSQTESVILDALQRLMEGRTTFMVAHRLSTIADADLILVLNHGEVAEHGTHDALLATGGLYAQLNAAQNGERRGRAAAAVPADRLAELTTAIVEGEETGEGLSGPGAGRPGARDVSSRRRRAGRGVGLALGRVAAALRRLDRTPARARRRQRLRRRGLAARSPAARRPRARSGSARRKEAVA